MQQGSAITDGDSASAITQQGSSSMYSPDDEVIEEDEVDDIVVEKEDKVLILPLFLRDGGYLYAVRASVLLLVLEIHLFAWDLIVVFFL